MRKALLSIISVIAATAFVACNNGEYNANPSSAANGSINPMYMLDSAAFNWGGADAVSAYVNGTYVHIDSPNVTFNLVSGNNIITAYTAPNKGFRFELADVYTNNIYSMGLNIYSRMMFFSDSVNNAPITYYSYFGNVGQVQIIRNDPDRMIGRFHFQALNTTNGSLINVSQGWFNIRKY